MQKKYRNALLELVRAAHLDPRKFTAREDRVVLSSIAFEGYRLKLESSSVDFVVATRLENETREFKYGACVCEITAHGPRGKSITFSDWTSDFSRIEVAFGEWLNSAGKKYFSYRAEEEEDLNTPDLWAELDMSPSAAADFQALKNTPFSSEEQSRIADTLSEFLKEVESQELLSADGMRDLHEQVDYLIAATKRLGRKDWVMAATGALFSFTLQAGLTGSTAGQLLRLATDGLQWIVVHIPLLYP